LLPTKATTGRTASGRNTSPNSHLGHRPLKQTSLFCLTVRPGQARPERHTAPSRGPYPTIFPGRGRTAGASPSDTVGRGLSETVRSRVEPAVLLSEPDPGPPW
jgi:hypothetical protein